MVDLLLPRRRFLAGLVGLVAAPAVVRIASLMPVKALPNFELRGANWVITSVVDSSGLIVPKVWELVDRKGRRIRVIDG